MRQARESHSASRSGWRHRSQSVWQRRSQSESLTDWRHASQAEWPTGWRHGSVIAEVGWKRRDVAIGHKARDRMSHLG